MAYTSSALTAREVPFTATRAAAKPGFFSWLIAAMMAARTRQAEREIAIYLHRTGGKFTDEAEREIERRFLSGRQGF